jgi:hypothetical protein
VVVPAFYTAVVLLSVRFCKKREVILVGLGCIGLTLLSDFLTSETASTQAGVINTGISLLAIATTTYLALKIEAERSAAYEARSQLAHVGRVTTLGQATASWDHQLSLGQVAQYVHVQMCLYRFRPAHIHRHASAI